MARKLQPPPGHEPGVLLARDPVPASRAAVGCLVLLAFCAAATFVQVVAGLLGRTDTLPVIAVTVLVGLLVGGIVLRAARGLRGQYVGARLPDAFAVDTHGIAARCDGRSAFRYSWRQVRRLDAGAGRESGWLRLWLVEGVPGPEGLPAARRTTEDALLLLRFGPGAERAAVAEAIRRYAPQGVRVRL